MELKLPEGITIGQCIAVYLRDGVEVAEFATKDSSKDPNMIRMFIYRGGPAETDGKVVTTKTKKFLFWKKDIVNVGGKELSSGWKKK